MAAKLERLQEQRKNLDGFELIYFPKRDLHPPVVCSVDPRQQEYILWMRGYLDKQPVFVYGLSRAFYAVHPEFAESNQFRGNNIAVPIGAMQLLARRYCQTGEIPAGQRLYDISVSLLDRFWGREGQAPYNEMIRPEEKLALVHAVEDGVITALEMIGGLNGKG